MKDCAKPFGTSFPDDLCKEDRVLIGKIRREWWMERLKKEKDRRRRDKALSLISTTNYTDDAEGVRWAQEIADAALLGNPHPDLDS